MSDNRELSVVREADRSPVVRRKRPKVHRESPDMAAFVARVARGMVKRAEAGDLEALSALRDMAQAVDQATKDAARALHNVETTSGGYSWTEIGRELGITRQAALKRFG